MALELMDRQGIVTAILSLTTPGVHLATAARAAREYNEFGAELVREDHPGRFGCSPP